jgi:hypothetical protein
MQNYPIVFSSAYGCVADIYKKYTKQPSLIYFNIQHKKYHISLTSDNISSQGWSVVRAYFAEKDDNVALKLLKNITSCFDYMNVLSCAYTYRIDGLVCLILKDLRAHFDTYNFVEQWNDVRDTHISSLYDFIVQAGLSLDDIDILSRVYSIPFYDRKKPQDSFYRLSSCQKDMIYEPFSYHNKDYIYIENDISAYVYSCTDDVCYNIYNHTSLKSVIYVSAVPSCGTVYVYTDNAIHIYSLKGDLIKTEYMPQHKEIVAIRCSEDSDIHLIIGKNTKENNITLMFYDVYAQKNICSQDFYINASILSQKGFLKNVVFHDRNTYVYAGINFDLCSLVYDKAQKSLHMVKNNIIKMLKDGSHILLGNIKTHTLTLYDCTSDTYTKIVSEKNYDACIASASPHDPYVYVLVYDEDLNSHVLVKYDIYHQTSKKMISGLSTCVTKVENTEYFLFYSVSGEYIYMYHLSDCILKAYHIQGNFKGLKPSGLSPCGTYIMLSDSHNICKAVYHTEKNAFSYLSLPDVREFCVQSVNSNYALLYTLYDHTFVWTENDFQADLLNKTYKEKTYPYMYVLYDYHRNYMYPLTYTSQKNEDGLLYNNRIISVSSGFDTMHISSTHLTERVINNLYSTHPFYKKEENQ